MTFAIEEQYLPVTLTAGPMSDQQFEEFCAQYPDFFIEMTAEGEILIMPPNHWYTSAQNHAISVQLGIWALADARGIVTDSSGGFFLPNGARRSPDVAWISNSRIDAASKTGRRVWHLAPDFVIELKSQTDRLRTLRAKMQEWIDNSAQLAWLIDPDRRAVEIYRPQQQPEILEAIDSLTAGPPLEGFTLDLKPVWDPRARNKLR